MVVAHPECPADVLRHADFIGSTSAIIDYCGDSPAREFIVMTESGVNFSLERVAPGKKFHYVANENCNCSECPFMRLNTLEKLRDCLLQPGAARGDRPDDLMRRALVPLERMLADQVNCSPECPLIDKLRPRARQSAHQRHGSLQYPLLLLHAGRRRAVHGPRRDPELRRDRALRRVAAAAGNHQTADHRRRAAGAARSAAADRTTGGDSRHSRYRAHHQRGAARRNRRRISTTPACGA